ncbi:hypothetical protein L208DRAFT_1111390, partial [Tricholoma matsutake]
SDPDYKSAHINAVKKNQVNDPNYKTFNLNAVKKYQEKQSKTFPPPPPSKMLQHTIITNACKDTAPNQFMESGCTVCGELTPILQLHKLSELSLDL